MSPTKVARDVDTAPAAPQLLDLAGCARLLNVRERQVKELVWRGEIPFVRIGPRLLRFDPERVAAWLAERENVSAGR